MDVKGSVLGWFWVFKGTVKVLLLLQHVAKRWTSKVCSLLFSLKFLELGLSSSRIISTGPRIIKKSSVVTGDIGHQPKNGVKWRGKQAVTTRGLEKMRAQKQSQTKAAVAARNPGL